MATLYGNFTTTLQSEIYTMLANNECGGPNDSSTAYSLSSPVSGSKTSGYTFGWLQYDLPQNGDESDAYKLIEKAIDQTSDTDLVSKAQDMGWTDAKDADLIRYAIKHLLVTTKGKNEPFVDAFKDLINPELKKLSNEIDNLTITSVKQIETYVDNVISKITNPDNKSFIEQSEIGKLIIADIKNQHSTQVNKELQRFLNGEEAYPNNNSVQIQGELGIEDLLRFRLSTDHGKKNPSDVLRRFSNTVEALGADNITLTEEDREFLKNGLKDFNPALSRLWPTIIAYGDNVGLRELMTKAIFGSRANLEDIIKDIMSGKLSDAIAKIRSIFNTAEVSGSPIVLDLDKDGVETTALNNGTYFDHDANGFAEQTGWVDSDDGLLVMDRDNDGLIEDGTELFGDQTILSNGKKAANGFKALVELDNNADGKIDANDTAFSQLRIWSDANGDGYNFSDFWQSADRLFINRFHRLIACGLKGEKDINIKERKF